MLVVTTPTKITLAILRTRSCAALCLKLDILLRNSQASWCFEYNLSFPCLLTDCPCLLANFY